MTNALAIASIALSIMTLFAGSAIAAGAGRLEMALSIVGIVMTVIELFSRRRYASSQVPNIEPGNFRFPIEKGLVGGMFGGVIAAPIIATVFHFVLHESRPMMAQLGIVPPPEMHVVAQIFIASIAIGAVVGPLTVGFAALFNHWRRIFPLAGLIFNAFSGAMIGGFAAGLICGPLGTLYFGQQPLPFLVPSHMLLGAIPAAGIMTFAIVSYDNRSFDRQTLRNLFLAMAATGIVGVIMAVIVFALAPEIMALMHHYIATGQRMSLLTGGLFYGSFIGVSLGLVVGLTMIFVGNEARDKSG